MTKYNLILILNKEADKVLMCKRQKDPYTGKYNLVGGKIEEGEDHLESAYRELVEETGINKTNVTLQPFMEFVWYPVDMQMSVYIGKLQEEVALVEEDHPLYWIPLTSNFFDTQVFAGEGNIGHMIAIYQLEREAIFHD